MEARGLFSSGYFGAGDGQFSQDKRVPEQKPGEHFTVEDLLDFSNEEDVMTDGFFDTITGNSTDSSTVTVVDSCNSSVSGNVGCRSFSEGQFSGDLCVPYDDFSGARMALQLRRRILLHRRHSQPPPPLRIQTPHTRLIILPTPQSYPNHHQCPSLPTRHLTRTR
ncbi:hypothetical protein L1049_005050 [Liquidambar formosana]|uniref:Uncharacterized protein n=1 Tax=Liquidambar formosana TaxID=63359 RepID=A0AAP0RQ05_LIQFO